MHVHVHVPHACPSRGASSLPRAPRAAAAPAVTPAVSDKEGEEQASLLPSGAPRSDAGGDGSVAVGGAVYWSRLGEVVRGSGLLNRFLEVVVRASRASAAEGAGDPTEEAEAATKIQAIRRGQKVRADAAAVRAPDVAAERAARVVRVEAQDPLVAPVLRARGAKVQVVRRAVPRVRLDEADRLEALERKRAPPGRGEPALPVVHRGKRLQLRRSAFSLEDAEVASVPLPTPALQRRGAAPQETLRARARGRAAGQQN